MGGNSLLVSSNSLISLRAIVFSDLMIKYYDQLCIIVTVCKCNYVDSNEAMYD